MTRLPAAPRAGSDVRAARVAAGAVLVGWLALSIGVNVHLDHQKPLYARFLDAYSSCLTGTAWDPRSSASEQSLDSPPRLVVYGSEGSGQLVFTARTRVGSDRIWPADVFTAQVLPQRGCSAG